jgi:hypothetical protein
MVREHNSMTRRIKIAHVEVWKTDHLRNPASTGGQPGPAVGLSNPHSGYITQGRLRSELACNLREADHALGGNLKPSLRPEIADALVARSADLIWLRDEAGIRFTNVDYGLVGTTGHPELDSLHRVEDFSPVDPERLAALRATVERKIGQTDARSSTVRSFFHRWIGGAAQ